MKRGFNRYLLGVFITLLSVVAVHAQTADFDLNRTIPLDSRVKTGILPNGLKYYIQKNAKPEKRVELRLAVNAGSILEDDDQLGLAHFVEHMCFNGTKNFKKNEIVNYLQSVGVQFGPHLNAYTSFDETVYILSSIPSDKKEIVDKSFQILEDWAHNVTFEPEEIEKERGVVIEEWRTGLGAEQRMDDKTLPVILKGSRYADRLPIGKEEILKSFKHESLIRFYRDWYRPDLMAVIVVGDIDPNEAEAKIKEHFGRLQPATQPRERKTYDIPDHAETLIATARDKEATLAIAQLTYKLPKQDVKTFAQLRQSIVEQLYTGMLNRRLRELSQQPNPPFTFSFAYYGDFFRAKNAYGLFANVNATNIENALKTILLENKKVADHGFTQSEMESYKKELLASLENSFKEQDKTNSPIYAGRLVSHFLTGRAIPSEETRFTFVEKILPTITIAEVNQLSRSWIRDENFVVTVTGPEKDDIKPVTEATAKNILKEVSASKTDAYVFKEVAASLMAALPTPGRVVQEKSIEQLGATELTLNNGVKVILKSTNFKNDEIQMSAFSFGGNSLAKDEDALSASYAASVVSNAGVAALSRIDLEKFLSGKTVNVNPYISQISEGLNGRSSVKDFETMLQLVNLYFREPRNDRKSFESLTARLKIFSQNTLSNPESYFFNEVQKILSQNHPRAGGVLKPEEIDKINYEKAFEIYRDRFADASDFHFIFVGNFDINQIKPLLELYLGSLPSKNRTENFKDLGIRPPTGELEYRFKKGKEPKTQVSINLNGNLENDKDGFLLRMLGQALTIKLIEKLREEKGGVYGTSARALVSKYPYQSYRISVGFTCAPENAQSLIAAVYEELEKVRQNGPTPEDVNKVKEAQIRELEKNLKENSYWTGVLQRAYFEKLDVNELTEANIRKLIGDLSVESLRLTAQKYLNMDNRVVVIMNPEK